MTGGIQQTNFGIQPAGQTSINATLSGPVTATAALPVPGTGQVLKTGTASLGALGAGGTATIYTVTGGKTFYLSTLTYTIAAAGAAEFHIQDNTTDILIYTCGATELGAATEKVVTVTFPTPIQFTNAVVFKAINALLGGNVNVIGFEQ